MDDLAKFLPISFKFVYEPVACFHKADSGSRTFICVNNVLVVVLSNINLLLISYLTFLHFKLVLQNHTLC